MFARVLCIIFIVTQAAAAGLLPRSLSRLTDPTTQRAEPLQTFSATDLPLRLKGATGELAKWLKGFDVPPRPFDYTLQLLEDEDGIQVYRLVFDSPFKSPFPENNIVSAEYYLPSHRTGKIPAAIVLDIMQGNSIVPRGLARGLASQGVAALYVPMAYYNGRRPKDNAHIRWLDEDPTRAIEPPRQTVMDIRRAKAILSSREEVDPARIGITGVSLGGIITALAAGVDGDFYRVVPILAGGDLANMLFHAPETRKVREKLVARGIDQEKLEPLMAPVEPLNFASRVEPGICLMLNASKDEVIPRDCTMALWNAIGKPTLLWVPSGHYGAALYLPTIKQTAIDFLKGKTVTRLEF